MGVQSLRRDRFLPASPFIGSMAWNPLFLGTSLKAYWDASRLDLITKDVSNLVSSWKDCVANYDAIAAGAARPTYSATGFNGYPVINGDGVANEMTLAPVPASVPTGATACEEWYLVDQKSLVADATTRIIGAVGNATGRRFARAVVSAANRAQDIDAATTLTHATADFSGRHVVRLIATGTTIDIEVDGVSAGGSAQVSAVTTTRIRFFANAATSAGSFALAGIVARAITLPLPAAQAARMLAFLNLRR